MQLVTKKAEKLKNSDKKPGESKSLLESYLSNPNLDFKDVVGMSCDMLLAGIDTVSLIIKISIYIQL